MSNKNRVRDNVDADAFDVRVNDKSRRAQRLKSKDKRRLKKEDYAD